MKFVNLHAHTTFSINDGLNYPKDHFDFVIKNAEDASMAMAISDHGNANSFGYAFQAANEYKKKGIPFKFIPACEFYYHPDLEEWKKIKAAKDSGEEIEEKAEDELIIEIEGESKGKWFDPIKRRHHLVVVAYNQVGLTNLYRLVSRSYRDGFYSFPRVDNRMLAECQEGLLISTACIHPDEVILSYKHGWIPIKKLVEKIKSGEEIFVLSYDEKEKKDKFKKVLWGDKTRKNSKLLKITTENGLELRLTSDHKVFTDQGWVEAKDLTVEHKILSSNGSECP